MKPIRATLIGLLGVSTLALAACGSGSSTDKTTAPAGSGGSTSSGSIVIGSANFTESELLGDIYGAALSAKGVKVSYKPKIGAREVYLPALKDGSIDLVPEYSGVLLQYFDKTATAASSDAIFAALGKATPSGLSVLDQSKAEDKDSIAVTAATASKYSLKSIADLESVAGKLTVGAAPEFKTRPDGIPGLKKTYNVVFRSFKTLDAGGKLTITALKNGQVDAADVFTTDPSIEQNKFVVLEDPKNLYAAQNVLPLISTAKATDTVKAALNAVSAKLDTATLTELDGKVYGGEDASKVAADWVKSVGLS